MQGRIQTHVIVVISQDQFGKCGKQIGEKSGKLSTKWGKIGTSTKSVLALHPHLLWD